MRVATAPLRHKNGETFSMLATNAARMRPVLQSEPAVAQTMSHTRACVDSLSACTMHFYGRCRCGGMEIQSSLDLVESR